MKKLTPAIGTTISPPHLCPSIFTAFHNLPPSTTSAVLPKTNIRRQRPFGKRGSGQSPNGNAFISPMNNGKIRKNLDSTTKGSTNYDTFCQKNHQWIRTLKDENVERMPGQRKSRRLKKGHDTEVKMDTVNVY